MSVQDDKDAAQDNKDAGQDDKDARQEGEKDARQGGDQRLTEKPEPDEGQKEKAAEMMKSYEDRPTLVLPGTGGRVSGTAVNDWLDEDGNPKQESPDGGGSEDKAKDDKAENDQGKDEKAQNEQIEKDKAWNEQLREAAAQENKGEKSKKGEKS